MSVNLISWRTALASPVATLLSLAMIFLLPFYLPTHLLSFLPSFLRLFPSSFQPSFIHTFLLLFLPLSFLSFHPTFHPSFLPSLFPSFFPSSYHTSLLLSVWDEDKPLNFHLPLYFWFGGHRLRKSFCLLLSSHIPNFLLPSLLLSSFILILIYFTLTVIALCSIRPLIIFWCFMF